MKACTGCGETYQRRPDRSYAAYAASKWCTDGCRRRTQAATRERNERPYNPTADRFTELRHLLEGGRPLHEIPAALGTTPGALARWLYRHGHPQIGRLFLRTSTLREVA